MNNNGDDDLPHQSGRAGASTMNNNGDDDLPHQNGEADGGAQGGAAGPHQNAGDLSQGNGLGGAHHGAIGPHQNLVHGKPEQNGYNRVILGLNGFGAGLDQLDEARDRIGTAVDRIRFEQAMWPVALNRPVLYYAFRDAMKAIAVSKTRINDAMNLIKKELDHDNDLVMFLDQVRTIEQAVRMVSTSTMAIHSILVFVSELRLDGHGPRWRIQRGLDELHSALSGFQRYLDDFFRLQPPGFVHEEENDMEE